MAIQFDPHMSDQITDLKETVEMAQAYAKGIERELQLAQELVSPAKHDLRAGLHRARSMAEHLGELMDYLEEALGAIDETDEDEEAEEDEDEESEEEYDEDNDNDEV